MSEFELTQKKGYGSETLLKADSLEDIAAFAMEKSGDDQVSLDLGEFNEL